MNVLVANAGSSSVKLRVLDQADHVIEAADFAPAAGADVEPEIERFVAGSPGVAAVGHRIVHGGSDFRDAALIGGEELARLRSLSDLAPLHNAPALAIVDVLRRLRPDVPHIACFDTAFHSSLGHEAALYAIPREWIDRWGLRRYGFHGLSHAYASRRAAELLDRPLTELRLVTCHLGAGASLAAVAHGRSVDTTMGFTPNDGLVMATRSGSVDPGLVLWVQRRSGLSVDALEHVLERDSGVRGLSGTSGDMEEVLKAVEGGDEAAGETLDVYLHRLRGAIAAMAAAMAGVDALVFTGGVGENSPRIRAAACDGLAFLGARMDLARNRAAGDSDSVLTSSDASTDVLVVHAREDVEIAAQARRLAGRRSG